MGQGEYKTGASLLHLAVVYQRNVTGCTCFRCISRRAGTIKTGKHKRGLMWDTDNGGVGIKRLTKTKWVNAVFNVA